MKKLQRPDQVPEFLRDLHIFLMNLPMTFRDRICKQCNWSTATFYRKKRLVQTRKSSNDDKLPPIISNAEKEMIIVVMDAVIKEAIDYTKKYPESQ